MLIHTPYIKSACTYVYIHTIACLYTYMHTYMYMWMQMYIRMSGVHHYPVQLFNG